VVIASHYKKSAPEHPIESLTAFIMLKIVLVCCLAATAYGNQYFINFFPSYFIFNEMKQKQAELLANHWHHSTAASLAEALPTKANTLARSAQVFVWKKRMLTFIFSAVLALFGLLRVRCVCDQRKFCFDYILLRQLVSAP
jgi:predicted PurR-regulated permease PerM